MSLRLEVGGGDEVQVGGGGGGSTVLVMGCMVEVLMVDVFYGYVISEVYFNLNALAFSLLNYKMKECFWIQSRALLTFTSL